MTPIDIVFDGDGCWPDLTQKDLEGKVQWNAQVAAIALLPDGVVTDSLTGISRKVPILTLRLELPNGSTAVAQMKLEMLETIARAMRGRLAYLDELKAKGGRDS